jgi:hypothetical protein
MLCDDVKYYVGTSRTLEKLHIYRVAKNVIDKHTVDLI